MFNKVSHRAVASDKDGMISDGMISLNLSLIFFGPMSSIVLKLSAHSHKKKELRPMMYLLGQLKSEFSIFLSIHRLLAHTPFEKDKQLYTSTS